MEGPNEVHLDQLVAELEPQLVTTQFVLMAQLAFEVNALFFFERSVHQISLFLLLFSKKIVKCGLELHFLSRILSLIIFPCANLQSTRSESTHNLPLELLALPKPAMLLDTLGSL
jgi:hypothetical protein